MKDIITRLHITEKGTALAGLRKYVFMVSLEATKNEIKKAVKKLYEVDATEVNIIRTHTRARRYRGVAQSFPRSKKAIVTLKKGQSINTG